MPYRDQMLALNEKRRDLLEQRAAIDAELALSNGVRRHIVRERAVVLMWRVVRYAIYAFPIWLAIISCLLMRARGGCAQDETARTDARRVADTVMQYLVENRGAACPKVDDLVYDGYLSQRGRTTDPWGNPWKIDCSGEEPLVMSSGADGDDPTDDVSSIEEAFSESSAAPSPQPPPASGRGSAPGKR